MSRAEKIVEVEGKDFKIKEVPPIEAQKYKLVEAMGKVYKILQMGVYDTRKVCLTYPMSLIPKLGEYAINEELSNLLMKYVEVKVKLPDGKEHWLRLDNRELVEQHVPPMQLLPLEIAVIDHTTGFFSSGKFQDLVADQLVLLGQNIITTLTQSLAQSSKAEELPSEK